MDTTHIHKTKRQTQTTHNTSDVNIHTLSATNTGREFCPNGGKAIMIQLH